MKHNVALMIVSCDKYKDTWPTFFTCMKRFWADCNYPRFLVTNEICETNFDVKAIATGPEVSWSSKVRSALGAIKSDYIFLLLDDYYFDRTVNEEMLDHLIDVMNIQRADYLSFEVSKTEQKYGKIGKISPRNMYGKVLQPAIWRKDYLRKCMYEDDFSAWEFETRQKNNNRDRIIGNDYCTISQEIFWVNGVLQGKWYPDSIKRMNEIGITVDTSQRGLLEAKKVRELKIKRFLIRHTPRPIAGIIRNMLKRIGFKFVTSK